MVLSRKTATINQSLQVMIGGARRKNQINQVKRETAGDQKIAGRFLQNGCYEEQKRK